MSVSKVHAPSGPPRRARRYGVARHNYRCETTRRFTVAWRCVRPDRASKRHPCSARCAFALRPVTAAALPRMPAARAVYPPTHPAVYPSKHPARPAATRPVLLQGRARRGRASVFGADLGQDEGEGEGEGEGKGEGEGEGED